MNYEKLQQELTQSRKEYEEKLQAVQQEKVCTYIYVVMNINTCVHMYVVDSRDQDGFKTTHQKQLCNNDYSKSKPFIDLSIQHY